mmetsp:Transcript_1560/g.5034  ORF Transcript_1560/g.5034 Transcript_1560/m.5034 type:complete len:220 (-) Transcript_1560:648-1307(-)
MSGTGAFSGIMKGTGSTSRVTGKTSSCWPPVRTLNADSSRARVVNPTQTSSRTTGNSKPPCSSKACLTVATAGSGGRTAAGGRRSQRSAATSPESPGGVCGGKKGIFLRVICSSSNPLFRKTRLRSKEMVTLIMRGNVRLRSLPASTMNTTTAIEICLKLHSIAALPTMAYMPVHARSCPHNRRAAEPAKRPTRPPMSIVPVKLPEGTGMPVMPMLSAV